MPQAQQRRKIYSNQYTYPAYPRPYSHTDVPIRKKTLIDARKQKQHQHQRVKKVSFFSRLVSLIFMGLVGYYVMPFVFHAISMPLIHGHQNYENIKIDTYSFAYPTSNYLNNTIFQHRRTLAGAVSGKPMMSELYKTVRMDFLETKLRGLMSKYPTIQSAITVWDFNTGKYADINGSEIYPAASIIKVPVLIHLFKSIDNNELSVYDEMKLTDYFKASGSGKLQYAKTGGIYTIDNLAKTMIEDSDNSATNMLMTKLGSMTSINAALRAWGIKQTHVQTWLPDLSGTNYTTTNDMATMLYNLDNPSFLTINSREYIVDYMSHVKNDRLIPQGLGKGASFLHKTGDIGSMLGDAGIVFMPDGRKYIVVIMAKRPYNSPLGKDFIQQASKIIYNEMLNTK